jgi:NH3-dependent NAD+ synthetase
VPVLNPDALVETIVNNIRKFHQAAGVVRAELDLSGGIDSAVVFGLLKVAGIPTTAVFLGINSNPDAYARAKGLADALGERLINFNGTALFDILLDEMTDAMIAAGYDEAEIQERIERDPTILGSIRSTLRAPWGRAANRLSGGGIRHGTGNECEDRWLRFFQKGGDGEVDTNPISMLSKGEVYQLALALGRILHAEDVYARIINATPSADLWGVADKHNDQSEIGNYLGVSGYPVYSYVNPDGTYRTVGLIERVSRFLDRSYDYAYVMAQDNVDAYAVAGIDNNGSVLFGNWAEDVITNLVESAISAPEFSGIAPDDVVAVLRAARRVERVTRHKMNPNCPALTSRDTLVAKGILTNTLPV